MKTEFGDSGVLPPTGVLVHIGPHKTGTSAIQAALANAREAMADHGVIYPGVTPQHRMAALAITASKGATGLREARGDEWHRLTLHVKAARRRRVIVSSEAFAEADETIAAKVIRDLGPGRAHVVVTLRPLAKILPSAWQQNVRNQLRFPFEDWLDEILVRQPKRHRVTNFWHRHHHDQLIERWASIVGPGRLIAVVADDRDRRALPHSFETLLGLPDGFLQLDDVRSNRGLNRGELELIRQLNVEFDARKWTTELYHEIVHLGVIRGLQTRTPEPGEPGIVTPAWAVDRANEIAAASADRIRALGIPVMGDLDSLSSVAAPAGQADVDAVLPAAAMDAAMAGVKERLERIDAPPPLEGNARPIDTIPTDELRTIVRQRMGRLFSVALGRGVPRY